MAVSCLQLGSGQVLGSDPLRKMDDHVPSLFAPRSRSQYGLWVALERDRKWAHILP